MTSSWKSGSRTRLIALFLVAMVVPLAGCHIALQQAFSADQAKPGAVELNDGETLVFGRLRYVENGKPRQRFGFVKPQFRLRNAADGTLSSLMTTDADGFFYYVLPRGEYTLVYTLIYGPENQIYMPLQFPALAGQALYVGTIEVDIDVKYNLVEPGYTVNRLNQSEVVDEYEVARAALLERHPSIAPERIRKGLLTPVRGQVPRAFPGIRPR